MDSMAHFYTSNNQSSRGAFRRKSACASGVGAGGGNQGHGFAHGRSRNTLDSTSAPLGERVAKAQSILQPLIHLEDKVETTC